jgi:RecA/RadA recombinase
MPNIIGTYPILQRQRTGLFSLDKALSGGGELGAPMRTVYEIYGYQGSGKSTLCYYLLGKLNNQKDAAICDLENLDMKYLESAIGMSGYEDDVHVIDVVNEKKKVRSHEDMLMEMVQRLSEGSGAVLLDSVGAIQPLAEAAGDFGEAFMGKRAKLVAQVSRALANNLRNVDHTANAYVINHVHQIIGGRGHTTAGGETLKYMAGVRMMIWAGETFWDDTQNPTRIIGYVAKGKTEKMRFGGKGREFQYYIVPGVGVHPGATALFDCVELGLVERGTTLKMNGKSLGYLKKDFLDHANGSKSRRFDVFFEVLQEYEANMKWDDDTVQDAADPEEVVDVARDDKPKKRRSKS